MCRFGKFPIDGVYDKKSGDGRSLMVDQIQGSGLLPSESKK